MDVERGSTRSHSVENSLWKRLLTSRETDNRINVQRTNLIHFYTPTKKDTGRDNAQQYKREAYVKIFYRNFVVYHAV